MPANANGNGTPFRGSWSFAGLVPEPGYIGYYPPFDNPGWDNVFDAWTVLEPGALQAGAQSEAYPFYWQGGYPLTNGNWYKLEFDVVTGTFARWQFAIDGETFDAVTPGHYEFVYFSYVQPDLSGLFFGSAGTIIQNFFVTDTEDPAPFELDADGLPWYNADGSLEYLPTP